MFGHKQGQAPLAIQLWRMQQRIFLQLINISYKDLIQILLPQVSLKNLRSYLEYFIIFSKLRKLTSPEVKYVKIA